ncbi:MAG: PVC-type heme-binding CxxCH protein [Pirellulales bacterium]
MPSRSLVWLAACLIGAALTFSAAVAEGPRSPAESLAAMRLADPNVVIELVAAEPDVVSPVAITWDAAGRMYVAEMRDYPLGPGTGQITRLVDADGDGRYEQSVVFATGLPFPNGLLPYRDGLLVTAAPDLWFLRDADGDGQAEERTKLWTGFGEGNQQLRANGLAWGLDGWVYGANGRSDGSVRSPNQPEDQAVSIRQRDFRFRPAENKFEALVGGSQFGLAWNEWGERFPSWNTNPLRHVVRDAIVDDAGHESAGELNDALAEGGDWGLLYPAAARPETFNREPVDRFNASCGPAIYRDDLLGDDYRGNAFVCEPLLSLVHRRRLVPQGVTYVAERTEREVEFLASTDPWFHPVNVTTGPDGCLYVVDFYRRWVEHPLYVPENLRDSANWREGAQHGRIWRIRPQQTQPRTIKTWPADANTPALVAPLGHAGGWWRETAQRLIVERRDPAAVDLLQESLKHSSPALARLHALYALAAMRSLGDAQLAVALSDSTAGVRRHAVRLARGRAPDPPLLGALSQLASDPDPTVRFELAQSAASLPPAVRLPLLAKLAARDAGDRWMRSALVAAAGSQTLELVDQLIADPAGDGDQALLADLATRIGQTGDDTQAALCLTKLAKGNAGSKSALAALAGLGAGLERRGRPLRAWLAESPAELASLSESLQASFAAARAAAASAPDVGHRALALAVLAHDPAAAAGPLLIAGLPADQPEAVQQAAVRALGQRAIAAELTEMLERYERCTLPTRREIVLAALRKPAGLPVLVEGLEEGALPLAELDPAARDVLRRAEDPALHDRIEKLLAAAPGTDRQQVLDQHQAVLNQPGDARSGAAVFAKHCLTCHQVAGRGQRVGPDLSGIASRPKAALLEDILAPSRQIAGDQQAYMLVTSDGQVLLGLLARETSDAATLRRAEGLEDVVPRSQIDTLRATGRSLMPEGFEQQIPAQGLADLLEFLKAPRAELFDANPPGQ